MKGIWKYKHLLPQVGNEYQLSIGEGETPLVRSKNIGSTMGLDNLFFKLENLNPSGSYKDRFAALALSLIQEQGSGFCLATSSGNTGAALAAYSAVAGIPCILAIVDGAPEGKLTQMRAYGADTMMIKDFGRDVRITQETMALLDQIASERDSVVQVSAYHYSPLSMQGVQTIAYEIAERAFQQKVNVFVPAGGGGLTLAVCKGFERWKQEYPSFTRPLIHCVQPNGNDTMATSIREGRRRATPVMGSRTGISGLQVPNVLDGDEVAEYCADHGGLGHVVYDEEVYEWQYRMAREEGIFCEPAGAVALAGLAGAIKRQEIRSDEVHICVVSGHGFKDPPAVVSMADRTPMQSIQTLTQLESEIIERLKK